MGSRVGVAQRDKTPSELFCVSSLVVHVAILPWWGGVGDIIITR